MPDPAAHHRPQTSLLSEPLLAEPLLSEPLTPVLPPLESAAPIAVVGAGPVGQTAALLLARWGLPVVLFDARPERDPVGSKALCQARDVLDIWATVGAGELLAHEGVTWTTARTFYRDREIAAWSFTDRGRSPFPPYVNIGQQRTEEVLDQRLVAAGIETCWSHELRSVDQDDAGATLEFATPEGSVTVSSPYALIATGARSDDIRNALGLSFDGETFEDYFLICDIRAELPGWEQERRFYFDPEWNPGRQVLIHACPDSTYRIDWQVPADYDLAADEASGGLDRRIRQIVGERPYEIVWKSLYRFHSRHTDRMRLGRILLAGDVAHLVSPFGARGLNTGVFDAENAAWKIAFAARGWGGPALLESYHDERLQATRENIEVTGATMRFLVPGDQAERDHRLAVLERAARDAQAARDVDSGRFAEPFWYLDSALTTAHPERDFAGRPPRGQTPSPGPGIVLPDVPLPEHLPLVTANGADRAVTVSRLRELARLGVLLLAGAGVDAAPVAVAASSATAAPIRVLSLPTRGSGPATIPDLGPAAATEPPDQTAPQPVDLTEVAALLDVRPGEVWVIRPDAYVAAIVDADPAVVATAVAGSLGYTGDMNCADVEAIPSTVEPSR